MRINTYMKNALNFAGKYLDWHSYTQDKITMNTINKLVVLGLVKTNKYNQFRITEEGLNYVYGIKQSW